MPILNVYVDENTLKRLKVYAACMGVQVDTLTENVLSEAAIQAVPCINGEPIRPEHRAAWSTFS